MPVWARPVRTLARLLLRVSMDLAILSWALFLTSATDMLLSCVPNIELNVYECTLVFAHDHALERTRLDDREHLDRQLLVAAQGERGGIHHLQVPGDRLVEGDRLVTGSMRI